MDQRDATGAGASALASSDAFDRLFVINLPSRDDRRLEMDRELRRIGLALDHPKVALFSAVRPSETAGFPTIGARGCFLSHLGVLDQALAAGHQTIVVCEDDLDFAQDAPARLPAVMDALAGGRWDIVYAGDEPHPSWRSDDNDPRIATIPHEHGVTCTHFILYRAAAMQGFRDYLRAVLTRAPGDPLGGPMHVDGALSMFRAARPDLVTLGIAPPLGRQRPSRTDIHDLNWFDRLPVVRGLMGVARRIKRRARRA